MRTTMVKYDENLKEVVRKQFACGSCGKKRRRNAKEPWAMLDRRGKIVWKNRAYTKIEGEMGESSS